MSLLKLLSLVAVLVGILFLVAFSFFGGDEIYNGAIHEPFYLIIFGIGLIFVSIFLITIDIILSFFDKSKEKK
jgi:hypothetical protein